MTAANETWDIAVPLKSSEEIATANYNKIIFKSRMNDDKRMTVEGRWAPV